MILQRPLLCPTFKIRHTGQTNPSANKSKSTHSRWEWSKNSNPFFFDCNRLSLLRALPVFCFVFHMLYFCQMPTKILVIRQSVDLDFAYSGFCVFVTFAPSGIEGWWSLPKRIHIKSHSKNPSTLWTKPLKNNSFYNFATKSQRLICIHKELHTVGVGDCHLDYWIYLTFNRLL